MCIPKTGPRRGHESAHDSRHNLSQRRRTRIPQSGVNLPEITWNSSRETDIPVQRAHPNPCFRNQFVRTMATNQSSEKSYPTSHCALCCAISGQALTPKDAPFLPQNKRPGRKRGPDLILCSEREAVYLPV